ncbi:MAG: hypothetical protein J6A59_02665 [Lachnospiraceae bacterium]|nr:hypothetical protein [Lachnospiraceae bacterium]
MRMVVVKLRKFIAVLLSVALLCNIPYFDPIIVMAEDITLESTSMQAVEITVDSNTSNNYIFGNNANTNTLNINSGVVLSGNITTGITYYQSTQTINNYGTISGNVTLTNSSMSFVVNNSGSMVSFSSSVSSLTFSGGTVGTFSVSGGSVTLSDVTVTDSLSITGGTFSQTGSITVSKATNVNVSSDVTVTVTCDGKDFELSGVSGTMEEVCGVKVSLSASDTTGLSAVDTSALSSSYWYGDAITTIQYKLLPGYGISSEYVSAVKASCTGNGACDVIFTDADKILSITYTVADTDANLTDRTVGFALGKPEELPEGVVTFSVDNIYVGQTVNYNLSSDDYDVATATITYKKATEEDTAYSTEKPSEVGTYIARIMIDANYEYGAYLDTYEFQIKELEVGEAKISVADISYGGTLEPQYSSATNDTIPVVRYKLQSEDEAAYSDLPPTAVGEYNARVIYPATVSHTEAVDTTTFKINYLIGSGEVSVADVYVGTAIDPQYSTTTNLGVEPTVEYKLQIQAVDAYDVSVPTAVGAYNIRIIYPATEAYGELELIGTFNIMALETGDGTLDIQDVYVGTSILPVVDSTKNGKENVRVEYRLQGETEYTTTIPTAVGMYEARAIFAATYMYDVFIAEDTFEIKALEQGVGEISVEDVYVGTDISVSYSSETNTDNPAIEYKKAEEEDSAYQTTVPSQVGDYVVRATFPATPVYDKLVVTDEFTIKALEIGEGSVMVEDVYHGQTYMPIVASSTNGTDNVVIEYKLKDEADSEYTIEKSQDIGDYVVRATFPATPVYDKLVVTDEFAIKDYETGSCSVKIDDVYYGQSYEPVVESSTNGTSDVVIEYKLKGQDDSAYTTTKPQDIGNYVIRATFASVPYYKEAVATDEFAIKDFENGVGTLEVLDVICGVNVNPIIGSNTNGVENATIYYKVAGADDSKYTTAKPTAVGEYVAKAVFEAVGIYKEVTVTDAFTISYLAMPENPYAIEGTQGENEYYTSEIVIKAKDGYLISDIFGKDYKEQLTINSSTESKYIYLMNKETGEQTAGMLLESLYVDLVAPSVGAVNDTVYYGDKLEIALTDDNLTRVVVNGKEIAANELITQNNILTLLSEGGVTEYTIEVWDVAGNMTTTTISVASEWTKQGVIPAGVSVKLQANTPYSFGEGEWNVEGDNTSYSGNITFYVEEEEKLTFNQQ